MQIKPLFINVANLTLPIIMLQACSSGSNAIDTYEKLEQPPELVSLPSTEVPSIEDEKLITNGLGEKVNMLGNENSPILTLALNFDNSWQILEQVLKHQKIMVTDRNRDQGYYFVSFDTDSYGSDKDFLEGINQSLFGESFGLRKYQLTVKQTGKLTMITAKDLGAITTPKDVEDGTEEVVDVAIKGPADSQRRLLATLYKSLHDGFVEHEKR